MRAAGGVPEAASGGWRIPWLVWGVAISAYSLGVFHRSSLSVAGLEAADRFGISATQLGAFIVLQLAVYAAAQVPVGVLVDRFGSRAVLLAGTVVMSLGQLLFALADTYPLAVVARILVGLGDATTFVCVLRVAAAWFAPRQVAFVTQLTGPVGQIGAIASAVPMAAALSAFGWERSYLAASVLGLVVGAAVVVVVHDEPARRSSIGTAMSWSAVRDNLRAAWRVPGTRLGFWVHFSLHFSATSFALVWGFPYLVRGHGVSDATASVLLSVLIVAVVLTGPTVGLLVGRRPDARVPVVLGAIAVVSGVWTVVLAWPGHAPTWVLVVLVATMGSTGTVAMVAFDFVRTGNPPGRLATAIGIANQGGFVASLVAVLLTGVVVDVLTPSAAEGYPPGALRAAFATQYLLWLVGVVAIWRLKGRLERAGSPSG